MQPGTGDVKALAQSRPMGRDRDAGQTFLNYTVPKEFGDANGFQAGSTFKVFVLAAAIEQGIPLDKVIVSPGSMSIPEEKYEDCDGEPYGYNTWEPDNYDFATHRANLYTGTRLSINTFFAQLEQKTGICEPFELAKEMGVRLTKPTGDRKGVVAERVPSFPLGIADASPLEMSEAYATFAARGMHCASRPVTAILDSKKNVLKEYPTDCNRVMEESTADAVNDILRGVIESGFASAQALDQPAAGKTGTTQGGKAVWFVGYTPQRAAAAMIAGANEARRRHPARRPHHRWLPALRLLGLRLRRADLGRRDEGDRRPPRVRGLRLPGDRARSGPDLRAAAQAAQEGRPTTTTASASRTPTAPVAATTATTAAATTATNRAGGVPPLPPRHRRPCP